MQSIRALPLELEDLLSLAPHLGAHALDLLPDVVQVGHIRLSFGMDTLERKANEYSSRILQELDFLGGVVRP
jgi:hypothetical protein